MKYYIIAGEASGDLHGSNLIIELKKLDANASFRVWGGDKMQAAGATLVKHYRDLAFMGFSEVLKNLPAIFRNLKFCKEDILEYNPDALILIDYPGFNLRIAEWAKKNNQKVVFYISPQVWAWKEKRVKILKRAVDRMLVILPFEKDFYKKWDYSVDYVGHPLAEVIDQYKREHRNETGDSKELNSNKEIIALLPGSRKQEIAAKLPIMLKVSEHFPDYEFVVAKAPGLDDEFYKDFLLPFNNVSTVSNQTYALLLKSRAAMVTSGTATLETALFGVPEIVCYKGNYLSYLLARKLIKIKYISLVNLIMNREVVKELIQNDLTVNNLVLELKKILEDEATQQRMTKDYNELRDLLTQGGNASANAAQIILNFLTS